MKTIISVLAFILISNLAYSNSSNHSLFTNEDAHLLINSLLDLPQTKSGLEKYQEWAKLFHRIKSNSSKSVDDMALYFFTIFIADAQSKTHTLEEIGKDILDLFKSERKMFLKSLDKNPGMIPVVCTKIGEELTNKEKHNSFLKENEIFIKDNLYKRYADDCLLNINKFITN